MRKLPLDTVYEEFLESLATPATKHTWRLPVRRFQNYLKSLGIRSPYLAQPEHLLSFLNWLRTTKSPATGELYKDSVIATNRTAVKAFYQWALDNKKITFDPSPRLSRVRLSIHYNPCPLSPEETTTLKRRIVEPKSFEDCRTALAISLGLCQGFRIHEVCKVRVQDMDFKNKKLYVFGKGKKPVTLPLDPLVEHLARRMLKYQYNVFGDPRLCPVDWLLAQRGFPDRKGSDRLIHRSVKETLFKCKIEGHRFHDFRATYMTKVWTETEDPFLLCKLGRCTMETAQFYVLNSEKKTRDAFGLISQENRLILKNSKSN